MQCNGYICVSGALINASLLGRLVRAVEIGRHMSEGVECIGYETRMFLGWVNAEHGVYCKSSRCNLGLPEFICDMMDFDQRGLESDAVYVTGC